MVSTSQVANLRRVFCLTSLAAALAAIALVVGGTRSVDQAHAATGPCVKHSKRVIKHVKRHGKRKRVVRTEHYWTCAEAPTPSPAPVATPAPSTPEPAPAPNPITEPPKLEQLPEPEANALGVAAEDKGGVLRYSLTHPTVKPGRLTIQLVDKGEDEHTMRMQRVGEDGELEGPIVADLVTHPEEEPRTETIELQPGTYRMWCTIGHHAEHGMKAEIVVE